MLKRKQYLGYIWAAASILVFLAFTFLSQQPADNINSILNIKISPRVNGGEISRTIKHQKYETRIHRPVFDGVLTERKDGFVQIEWKPISGALPDNIVEDIDYDNNGEKDFTIHFNTGLNTVSIEKYNKEVEGISEGWIYYYKDIKGVRVNLRK